MTEDQQKTFIAGLRNGLGLSKTARLMLTHPREVSEYIKSNPSFNFDCEEAIIFASKVLLVNSDNMLRDKKFDKWQTQKGHISKFVTELIFWESVCKTSEITDAKVLEAYMVTNDPDDAATAVGLTRQEMKKYIMSRVNLYQAITESARL